MKHLFTILMFSLISTSVLALNHQDEVAKAQSWANSFNRPYPIVVFDRDEMNYLFARNGLLGEEKSEQRWAFIAEYVLKKQVTN